MCVCWPQYGAPSDANKWLRPRGRNTAAVCGVRSSPDASQVMKFGWEQLDAEYAKTVEEIRLAGWSSGNCAPDCALTDIYARQTR